MQTILVTGANGFVGKHLCRLLISEGYSVRAAVRSDNCCVEGASLVVVGHIGADTNWHSALQGVDAVIHLAARVHVLDELDSDPLTAFRNVNVLGTENLARQAESMGIKRFIYMSSIKATTSSTTRPSLESDMPVPVDPYGRSKQEAESLLLRIGADGSLDPVIIRPPLVFGAEVGGNFLRMLKIIRQGMPLPLAGAENRRSVVNVYNLCDFINHCLFHPKAKHQIFNVSDGEDLSTKDLLSAIGQAMGRPARLWSFPRSIMRISLRLVGKDDDYDRLFGSLQLSIDKAAELLDWSPVISTQEGIGKTVQWYCNQ